MRAAGLLLLFAVACSPGARPARDAGPDPIDATIVDAARPDASPLSDAGEPDAGELDGGAVLDAALDAGARDPVDDALARLASPAATASDLDALLRDVGLGAGWPLRSGGRWLFATRWSSAPDGVALVSDVNGWSTTAHAATRAASGVHYFVLADEASFAVPPEGAKYKWYGAPDVYRAPPEATAHDWDAFGEHGYLRPPIGRAYFERFPGFDSSPLDLPRAVRVRVPSSLDPPRARTLLLHDGQNVFDPAAIWGGWRAQETLSDPAFADVLAVAVDNAADRFDAYTHVPDDIGTGLVGGRAGDYHAMLRDAVLPFVRARYGVRARGGSLAIGGSSLGGLISLHLALAEPDLAGCVIAMSPTLGWGAFAADGSQALLRRFTTHGPVAIYLDSGGGGTCTDPDGDGIHEDADDADNYCTTVQLRDRLAGLGYAFDADLFHWHEPGAEHNEAAWAARLPMALAACATAGWIPP